MRDDEAPEFLRRETHMAVRAENMCPGQTGTHSMLNGTWAACNAKTCGRHQLAMAVMIAPYGVMTELSRA